MTTHAITLDQVSDPLTTRDVGYAAFCECDWRGDWHHADTQPSWPNDQAIDEAEQAASDEGDAHLAEHDDDPADILPGAAFLALPVPALDENGYAR